jgi:hypothetical protein
MLSIPSLSPSLLLAAALLAGSAAAAPQLGLVVNADASYAVTLDGAVWLQSAAPGYFISYDNARQKLTLDAAPTPVNGANYSGFAATFNGNTFGAEFQLYPAANAIVFVQHFPKALAGMAVNGGSSRDLASGFPVFAFSENANLGWLTWPETMCNGETGLFTKAGSGNAGLSSDGGSPLVLFNKTAATLVLGAYSGFMTANIGVYASLNGNLGAGYNGMLEAVPAGHRHETVLVAGQGVNDTVMAYGDLLLARSGKHRTRPDADLVISTLGYWTDKRVLARKRARPSARRPD